LGSKNGGTSLVAILTDLPDFATLVFIQRCHGPVVNHQNIDAAQSYQEVTQASISSCQGQLTQQGGGPQIESRVAVATGFLCQGQCDEALAHAGRTQHENVFVVADPGRVFCQSTHYRLVQATRCAIVDVLHTGRSSQLGRFQPSRQRLVLAPTPLLIDQQPESFEETQLVIARSCSCVFRASTMPCSRMASSFSIIGWFSMRSVPLRRSTRRRGHCHGSEVESRVVVEIREPRRASSSRSTSRSDSGKPERGVPVPPRPPCVAGSTAAPGE